MSRKHPQRTPLPRRWWQRLDRHCAQTLGAGWAAEHTVGRMHRLRRRCGHSALRLAVPPEPRISVVHQPHWSSTESSERLEALARGCPGLG